MKIVQEFLEDFRYRGEGYLFPPLFSLKPYTDFKKVFLEL